MRLEGCELAAPERVQPALQRSQPLRAQRVDACARVVVERLRIDKAALAQDPQVAAHRGRADARRHRELSRSPWPLAQQVDYVSPSGIGERSKCLIEIIHRLVKD